MFIASLFVILLTYSNSVFSNRSTCPVCSGTVKMPIYCCKAILHIKSENTFFIIKNNKLGEACSMYGGGERCVQDFGGET
jgi:hypothetical protein